MSVLEKNGDSDCDEIKKSNFFLKCFKDFERDYKNSLPLLEPRIGHSTV
jgi:hypothetical protein